MFGLKVIFETVNGTKTLGVGLTDDLKKFYMITNLEDKILSSALYYERGGAGEEKFLDDILKYFQKINNIKYIKIEPDLSLPNNINSGSINTI